MAQIIFYIGTYFKFQYDLFYEHKYLVHILKIH